MRRLIATLFLSALLCLGAWAQTTYYVDTNADPGGDGTTPALTGAHCAWDAIADVNGASFSAGDSVLFNKGCTWREQLTVPSSGSAGLPITFGAYGTGDDPIISGEDILTTFTICSAPELIGNPSFETFTGTADDATSDDFASWLETTGTGGIIEAVTNSDAYLVSRPIPNGTYACKMIKATSGGQTITITLALAASTAYTFIYKGLSDGSGSIRCALYYPGLTFLQNDGSWSGTANWNLTALGVSTANTTWTTKTLNFTSGAAATYTFYLTNYANWGTVYIDDFSCKQTTMASYQKTGVTTEPDIVKYNGVELTESDGATTGIAENKWDWASDVLYMNVGEDPDVGTVLASQRDTAITIASKDYITIDGLNLIGWQDRGIYATSGINLIIQNCSISGGSDDTRAMGIQYQGSGTLRAGIEIKDNTIGKIAQTVKESVTYNAMVIQDVDGAIISGNTINTTNTGSINIIAGSIPNNTDCLIENNDIYGCRSGIYSSNSNGTIIRYNKIHDGVGKGVGVANTSDDNEIYYNKIYNLTKGTNTWNGIDINYGSEDGVAYNNTIYKIFGHSFIIDDIGGSCDGWVIENNIFDASENGDGGGVDALPWKLAGASISYTSDYNCCYPKTQTLGGVENPTHYDLDGTTYYTLAGWQTAKTQESHSISSDPLMTDPDNGDFTLQAGSPCINAGTDVGLTEDYTGNPVPLWNFPDIGAYEYILKIKIIKRVKMSVLIPVIK